MQIFTNEWLNNFIQLALSPSYWKYLIDSSFFHFLAGYSNPLTVFIMLLTAGSLLSTFSLFHTLEKTLLNRIDFSQRSIQPKIASIRQLLKKTKNENKLSTQPDTTPRNNWIFQTVPRLSHGTLSVAHVEFKKLIDKAAEKKGSCGEKSGNGRSTTAACPRERTSLWSFERRNELATVNGGSMRSMGFPGCPLGVTGHPT